MKDSIRRAFAWTVAEVKQPRFRPAERKAIVWAVRAALAYFGVKAGVDVEKLVKLVVN